MCDKKRFISLLFVFWSCISSAQQVPPLAVVHGRLVHAETREPLPELEIRFPYLKRLGRADENGYFIFTEVPFGMHIIVAGAGAGDTIRLLIDREQVTVGDLYILSAGPDRSAAGQLPLAEVDEGEFSTQDEGIGPQPVSSVLQASRDPFLNTAAFVFGAYRFQSRGYPRNRQEVLINGLGFNDLRTGMAYWSLWGGLNDMFRSRSNTYGLGASEHAFGGLGGSAAFDVFALAQQKQTRITYSLSNRQYRHRLMLTHNSGLLRNGWAYSVSLSCRQAKEGYIEGTFYGSISGFAGISRQWKKHQLSLTGFGASVSRGKSSPVTQEVYDLAGSPYYNPAWGFQHGEKRNARVSSSFQPVVILNHGYSADERFRIHAALGFQVGKSGNSSLDWYQAKDPRPDYYRYLPGWQIRTLNDEDAAAEIVRKWKEEPEICAQIDWDRLYQVNYANTETMEDVSGIAGNHVTGRRSVYVVGNDVEAIRRYIARLRAERIFNRYLSLSGGIGFMMQRTEHYRELQDLLGGDFYLNLNQFADQQHVPEAGFRQFDLNVPDRLIRVGDKYNYHYLSRLSRSSGWVQGMFTGNRLDLFLSISGAVQSFGREGLFRNGLFPQSSFGDSPLQRFSTYAAKAGFTFKIDGRNYLFLNGLEGTGAPLMDHTFVSVRTRNQVVENPGAYRMHSAEGGYLMRAPKYNARLVAYVTDITGATEIRRFYNDDPEFRTFVNYVMRDLKMRFLGAEIALEARVHSSLSLTGVIAPGQAFYTANPEVLVYRDNDTVSRPRSRQVYIRNYYLSAGPQSAYSLGINYRSPKYWYGGVNLNYFDRNYISINPDRRTEEAAGLISRDSAGFDAIFCQERLPSFFTVDIHLGKSWLLSRIFHALPRSTYLYLNAGVSNLLNRTDIRTGGFEQLRFDFRENDPGMFPSKYFYSYGANYFLNLSLKF